jgi:hypothetical protein
MSTIHQIGVDVMHHQTPVSGHVHHVAHVGGKLDNGRNLLCHFQSLPLFLGGLLPGANAPDIEPRGWFTRWLF